MKKILAFIISIWLIPVCLFSQDIGKVVAAIDTKLSAGQTRISDVLSDPHYMYLHSQSAFRQVIKKHAKSGKIKIITDAEPGRKITVKARIETRGGKPVNNALVYFYHTSDKGWYSDTAAHIQVQQGDMGHARLFGYLKTDSKGQIEFETVQPKGYPGSDFPAHIHIMLWIDDHLINGIPSELQFDDDPRLTPARRARSLNEGNLIEKNSGSPHHPVYFYQFKVNGL